MIKTCNIVTIIIFLLCVLQTKSTTANYNYNGMMLRNFFLKKYLQLPMLTKMNKHFLKECKEKIINLYYHLPYQYYTLSDDDKLLIENILGTLL